MEVTGNGREPIEERRGRAMTSREELPHAKSGTLVASALDDVRDIVSLEMRSAKLELQKELKRVKVAAILGSTGALLTTVGLFVLALLCAWLLALVLPTWAAYLIIGGGVLLVGLLCLAAAGGSARKVHPYPELTAKDLKGDARWIREHASARR